MSHVDDGTLHALVDDELDDAQRAAVEAHLATCGDCAKRFAEATAMSRQVLSLLGALDEVPAPMRIAPVAPRPSAVVAPSTVTPIAQRMRTLRRVALAASVLLVAGVSYEVGKRRDAAPALAREAAPAPSGVALPAPASGMVTTFDSMAGAARVVIPAPTSVRGRDAVVAARPTAPSAATVASAEPITAMPPAPSVAELSQQKAVAERQAIMNSDVRADQAVQAAGTQDSVRRATSLDVQAQEQQRAVASQAFARGEQRSRNAAPAPVAVSDAGAAAGAAAPAPGAMAWVTAATQGALAGYRVSDEMVMPAVLRRRYIAADGTTLVLMIAPATTDVPKPTAKVSPEFTVSTANGRSTVRWQVPGLTYELQGALPPDSLVKLATQLK